jgi:hypothetical protein
MYPEYEVWGMESIDDSNAGIRRFREDCYSFEEAKQACEEWQSEGRIAWIINKNTDI